MPSLFLFLVDANEERGYKLRDSPCPPTQQRLAYSCGPSAERKVVSIQRWLNRRCAANSDARSKNLDCKKIQVFCSEFPLRASPDVFRGCEGKMMSKQDSQQQNSLPGRRRYSDVILTYGATGKFDTDEVKFEPITKKASGPPCSRWNEIVQSVSFASPHQVRSRKVVTRSRARSTGKYPSWKMGRMLQWESTNELNAFRLLDCDAQVRAFSEQPCEIKFVHDGTLRSHFPDLLVELEGKRELWEVKTEAEATRAEISERTALLTKGLAAWGYTYRVVFARDLLREPRLSNALLLLHHGSRCAVTISERESIQIGRAHV